MLDKFKGIKNTQCAAAALYSFHSGISGPKRFHKTTHLPSNIIISHQLHCDHVLICIYVHTCNQGPVIEVENTAYYFSSRYVVFIS